MNDSSSKPSEATAASFQLFLDQWNQDRDQAAEEIFSRFASRLVVRVQREMGTQLRRKLDAEDVVQSVMRIFFQRQATEEAFQLEHWGNLWGLLVAIMVNKCRNLHREYRRDRRDIQRERELDKPTSESRPGLEALDREPTPEESAIVQDIWTNALHDLDEKDCLIAEYWLQGHTAAEISANVGRSVRTVHRVLRLVRERLLRFWEKENSSIS